MDILDNQSKELDTFIPQEYPGPSFNIEKMPLGPGDLVLAQSDSSQDFIEYFGKTMVVRKFFEAIRFFSPPDRVRMLGIRNWGNDIRELALTADFPFYLTSKAAMEALGDENLRSLALHLTKTYPENPDASLAGLELSARLSLDQLSAVFDQCANPVRAEKSYLDDASLVELLNKGLGVLDLATSYQITNKSKENDQKVFAILTPLNLIASKIDQPKDITSNKLKDHAKHVRGTLLDPSNLDQIMSKF